MIILGLGFSHRCSATGHPLPIITWRREDGRPIQNHGKLLSINSKLRFYRVVYSITLLSAALTVEGSMIQLTRIPRQNIGAYLCIGMLMSILIHYIRVIFLNACLIASNGVPPSVSKRFILSVQCKFGFYFESI